ncbi:prolyl oligopeptidase family serine peptidase [Micromonospora sp. NPDC048063]|uniref:prolyl oligopeptidase family serine peptidase n=1 Tax=Micromonospora sp. NPDC048063 TaxID=3364256 RepID=UPI00370F79BE
MSLLGTPHGGRLALLAAMLDPGLVERVCVTSPITHLRAYLASRLGQKHRVEFPDDDDLDAYDPISTIARCDRGPLPQLMIICGAVDSTVTGQKPEEFAKRWRKAGGSCDIVWHAGGHYAPSAPEIERVEHVQASFLGLVAPRI